MRSNQSDFEMGGGGEGGELLGEDGDGSDEPRIRDRTKKMKIPLFGLVYKRQMVVNMLVVVLISAYITLLCLV